MAVEDDILKTEGWESLDFDTSHLDEKQRQKAVEFASLYRKVFESPAGKKILRHMIRVTVLQPTVTSDSPQFAAGIREGRADIVRGILQQIELAKTGGKGEGQ